MTPKHFKEVNVTYGKGQKEYKPLPALRKEGGDVVTCWRLSLKDLLRVIIRREVWLCVKTFGDPLQPIYMTTDKEEAV